MTEQQTCPTCGWNLRNVQYCGACKRPVVPLDCADDHVIASRARAWRDDPTELATILADKWRYSSSHMLARAILRALLEGEGET